MRNKIYNFFGAEALYKAQKLMEYALDLGITADYIDMMQESDGDDDTLIVVIAIYANHTDLARLDNFELFLANH